MSEIDSQQTLLTVILSICIIKLVQPDVKLMKPSFSKYILASLTTFRRFTVKVMLPC